MVLQLNKEIVFAKNFLQSSRILLCPSDIALQQSLQNMPAQTATRCDETLAVSCKKLPVHPRLVVVTLQKGEAGQLDQVLIAIVVFGKQRQVVVHLATRFGIATRIVDFPAATWSLRSMLVGHVGLGANDWLDAVFVAFAIKVENAVHISVVGNAKCGHALFACLAYEFIQT